ncbi:LysR family transcriptional regulator [Microlunatus speluncae]|uniref:LysR family transcriptional regulator n=1 Tax=Microlunatus speluncae TaxID=2594267 RepID=UPI0012663275|nr:LysR family transcriptional regulator [Microlunatus speluncae]
MAVTLQQLEIFRAVARNLSFSVAAKEVYTSQPHVSNQIRKLEEHYRVPLFIRSRPGIALTEAGVALYERINIILSDIEEAEQVIQQFRGLQRGTVRLAATASPGNHVIPGIVAEFQRKHPEVMVRMQVSNTEDVLERVDRDEAELAITPRRPEWGDLESESLYAEDLVVIFPSTMTLPDPLSVAEFAELPQVVREDGSLTWEIMRELVEDHDPRIVAQLGGTTAVNEAVAAGLGVSLVPETSAKAWLDAGSVQIRRLTDAQPQHHFFLIHSPQRYVTPATRALIEHLREWAASAPFGQRP